MAHDDPPVRPGLGDDRFRLSRQDRAMDGKDDVVSDHPSDASPRPAGRERLGLMSEEEATRKTPGVSIARRAGNTASHGAGRVARWVARLSGQARAVQSRYPSAGLEETPPPGISRRRHRAAHAGLTGFARSDKMSQLLAYGAAAIGAILALIIGVRSLLDGHRGEIAIIAPPALPVRERPADPGGLQVLSGIPADLSDFKTDQARLAPGPEQPKLSALAARLPGSSQVNGSPTTSPAVQAANMQNLGKRPDQSHEKSHSSQLTVGERAVGPSSALTVSPETGASHMQAPNVPTATRTSRDVAQPADAEPPASPSSGFGAPPGAQVKVVPPAQTSVAGVPADDAPQKDAPSAPANLTSPASLFPSSDEVTVSPTPPLGQFYVQLGAVAREDEARAEWARILHRTDGQLKGRSVYIVPKLIRGRMLYRIWLGGYKSHADAVEACGLIEARRIPCYAVRR